MRTYALSATLLLSSTGTFGATLFLSWHSLLCLAKCARTFRLTRPVISGDCELKICSGRNLVQEQLVESFIPNDFDPSDDAGRDQRIRILCGPNFSGKTVYLRQIATIVFLAHIGNTTVRNT